MSINRWIIKQIVYPYIRILVRNKKGIEYCLDETQNNCVHWKKPDKKEYILYHSIYIEIIGNSIYSDRKQIIGFLCICQGVVEGRKERLQGRKERLQRDRTELLGVCSLPWLYNDFMSIYMYQNLPNCIL